MYEGGVQMSSYEMAMSSMSRVMQNAVRPERERRLAMADHVERAKELTGKRRKRVQLAQVEESAWFLARDHGLAQAHVLAKKAVELKGEGRFDDPFAADFMESARRNLEASYELAQRMGDSLAEPVQDLDLFSECVRIPFRHAAEAFDAAAHIALITRAFRLFLVADDLAAFAVQHWDEHGWNSGFLKVWSQFETRQVTIATQS